MRPQEGDKQLQAAAPFSGMIWHWLRLVVNGPHRDNAEAPSGSACVVGEVLARPRKCSRARALANGVGAYGAERVEVD